MSSLRPSSPVMSQVGLSIQVEDGEPPDGCAPVLLRVGRFRRRRPEHHRRQRFQRSEQDRKK